MTDSVSSFLAEIEDFMSANQMAATQFGYQACNDYSFVKSVRNGRKVYGETMEKIREWMQKHDIRNEKKTRPVKQKGRKK